MVNSLADARKRRDTLRGDEWSAFFEQVTGNQKANWLIQKQWGWQKKRASKVETTTTFQKLLELFASVQTMSVGASDIPICVLPPHERLNLATKILHLYSNSVDPEFIKWLGLAAPLVIVWITGFKPKGDDSRPDRGLVPLARMLFGDEIEILAIISGPAKPDMWLLLQNNTEQLAQQNGLWEAVIRLSNAIFADSPTLASRPLTRLLTLVRQRNKNTIRFPITSAITNFSEHDVDTVIHLLFSTNMAQGIFEVMCNPPGGDWSGLSMVDFQTGAEFRWTSLPRVSGVGGKRPDHVIQFDSGGGVNTLLAIESKDIPAKIPVNLGTDLIAYIEKLFKIPPITAKFPDSTWQLWQSDNLPITNINVISGGAFCWTQESDLAVYLEKCQLDMVIAIEFDSVKEVALLHLKVRLRAEFLLPKIQHLTHYFGGRLKIQVH